MKKLTILILVLSVVVIACHKKAVPTVTERTNEPVAPVADSAKIGSATIPSTMAAPELVAGQTIYETKCTRCHKAKPVDKWTQEQWVPIMNSMAPKAKLDSIERANVTAYVNAHAKTAQ